MSNVIRDQLAHPRGILGPLAGWWMRLRDSRRSRWAIDQLRPRPGERILEIGYGAGSDLRRIALQVGERGLVAGVDLSAPMLRQATRRNKAFIREGRVVVQLGNVTGLPYPEQTFHAVYSVDAADFWPDLARAASEIGRVLRYRGRAVLVVERRAGEAERWRDLLCESLRGAGFLDVTGEIVDRGRRAWVLATGQIR